MLLFHRKTLLLASLAMAAWSRPSRGQTRFVLPDTSGLAPGERDLLRFEQARSAAIGRHDTTALRRMYADEFRGVNAAGIAVDRERLLGVFTRDDPTVVFEIDEMAVRLVGSGGDAALLTGRLTTRRRTGELVGASRFIHVYIRRDGRWQILAAQGSALAAPG